MRTEQREFGTAWDGTPVQQIDRWELGQGETLVMDPTGTRIYPWGERAGGTWVLFVKSFSEDGQSAEVEGPHWC